MRPGRRLACLSIAVLAAGGASCASAPKQSASAPPPPPARTVDERTIDAASQEFELGREAALAGDFVCARYRFGLAIDTLQPPDGPRPSPAIEAFSIDLYEGIQRYEALAGPTEEAGTSHGQIDPEIEAQIEAPETSPEAIATAAEAVASDHPVATPDVPIVVNDAVLRVVAAFQSEALHDKIEAGLVRSGRYLPMIHQIFAEEGVPQDLAMIAFIESSFLPMARSNKMAHGIWQFMPRTGRQYGLRSNGIVDERRDPEKSTRSAARYLSYLYEIFGDWYLAMAAYNAGEGKILRAMDRTNARDFWQLSATSAIRKQTKNYVPAFLAAVLISKNPSHYGFTVVPDPPMTFDTLRLDRSISLEDLAKATELPVDDFRSLNPELITHVTPQQPEGYELRLPAGMRESVSLAFAAVPTTRAPEFKTHVAKKGDTLPKIARRYGVSVSSIASANSLSTKARISRGQEIMVPEKAKKPAKSTATVVSAKSTRSKKVNSKAAPEPGQTAGKSYRVKSGDTLYQIALRHGTTVAEILAINGLGGASIKAGDKIKIPTGK